MFLKGRCRKRSPPGPSRWTCRAVQILRPRSHSLRSCGRAVCWWRSGDPPRGPWGAKRRHVWKWRPITHLHTVCIWGSVCQRRQPTMAMLKTETENNNSIALVSQGPFVCYFSAVFFHVGDGEGQMLPLPVPSEKWQLPARWATKLSLTCSWESKLSLAVVKDFSSLSGNSSVLESSGWFRFDCGLMEHLPP